MTSDVLKKIIKFIIFFKSLSRRNKTNWEMNAWAMCVVKLSNVWSTFPTLVVEIVVGQHNHKMSRFVDNTWVYLPYHQENPFFLNYKKTTHSKILRRLSVSSESYNAGRQPKVTDIAIVGF